MAKIPSFHKFLEEEKKKGNNVSLESTSNSIKIPSFNEYVNNQSYYDDIADKVYKQNELVRQAQENQKTREEETSSSLLDKLKYTNPVYALFKLPENAKKAVEAGKNFFQQSFFKEGEGNLLQNIGGTIADTGLHIGKGFLNYAEDIADFGVYKIADLAEFTGNKTTAEGLRNYADVRAMKALFGENEKNTENLNLRYLPEAIKTGKIENEVVPEKTLQEKIDKYSYFDRGMDNVAENVGQLLATMGSTKLVEKSGLTKNFENILTKNGVKADVAKDYAKSLNTALSSYSSAYGGTYESVRRAGYGDEEARKVARISGFVEAISEQLHDGIPGTKTAGWADKIIKIDNPKLKILFNALGEVDEEAFGSILSTVINDIRFNLDPDNPYLQDINLYTGDVLGDIYYNTLGDDAKSEYLTVFLSTLITNGMSEVNTSLERRKNAKENNIKYETAEKRLGLEINADNEITSNKSRLTESSIENIEKKIGSTLNEEGRKVVEDYVNSIKDKDINKYNEDKVFDYFNEFAQQRNPQNEEQAVAVAQNKQPIVKNELKSEENATETFNTDVNKYQGIAKKTVENAINSKLLNTSEKTNKIVDISSKISEHINKEFEFVDNKQLDKLYKKLIKEGKIEKGETINGYMDGDKIVVNVDSPEAINFIIGHEVSHAMKNSKYWPDLKDTLLDLAEERGDYQKFADRIQNAYSSKEDLNEELVSDLVGKYLFTDKAFIDRVSKNKNIVERIIDTLKNIVEDIKDTFGINSRETQLLHKAIKAYEKAYNDNYEENKGFKLSKTVYQDDNITIEELTPAEARKQDDKGRKLSTGQQKYFKKSVARDPTGSLITVYHTTTKDLNQFNLFDPRKSSNYKFGNNIVIYTTNDKDMSGSYARNGRFEKAKGDKLKNYNEAIEWLDDNRFGDSFTETLNYDYEIDKEDDKIKLKLYNWRNGNKIAEYEFDDEKDFLKNVREKVQNVTVLETNSKQYEGYVNIENPLVVNYDGKYWAYDFDKETVEKFIDRDWFKKNIMDKYKYNSLKQLTSDDADMVKLRYQLERIAKESFNKWSENSDRLYNERNIYDFLKRNVLNWEQLYQGLAYFDLFSSYEEFYNSDLVKEYNFPAPDTKIDTGETDIFPNVETTLGEIMNEYKKYKYAYDHYRTKDTYFNQMVGPLIDDLDLDEDKYDNLLIYMYGQKKDLFDFVMNGFDLNGSPQLWVQDEWYGKHKMETNNWVQEALELNKKGANYDGVIIKDVRDYGGTDVGTEKPNDLYIVFSPEQFKSVENKNPTSDPDWRYSLTKGQTEEYGDFNIYGKDIKAEKNPLVKKTKQKVEKNSLVKQIKQEKVQENVQQPVQETTQTKKVLNPVEISKLTKEDANTTPKLPKKTYNKVGDGLSDQVNTLPNTQLISEEQKKAILEQEEFRTYDKITNKESLEKAFDRLNKNGKQEVFNWFNKNPNNVDATDIAEGAILMKQYADNNDTEGLVEVAKKFRDMKTKTAQTLQASSILSRLTPEGMVMYAQSELEDAYNELIKNKTKEWIDAHKDAMKLTSDDVRFIMDTMKKVSQMPDGYDKKVELAKIQKLITDKIEPNFTKSLKGWMRISMLFNPKTQVRNVGGNALILPVNAGSDIVASWADKLISKKTGVRTTGNFKARNFIEGSKRGAYQSTNDFKLGINTRNMEGNRMEIGEGKSFSDKTILGRGLNRVESILNYAMDLGDRVFSEGWYENSLQNQMELNGVDTPTQEMIDIANQEALQRTWNDNNNYTKFVLDIRRALNRIGGNNYGLGDVLIPFAKTPANLTKAIVDYSPAGMVNALLQYRNLNKAIGRGDVTSQQQHQFVQTLGKATAGSILYILGYALAKAGIITGEADDDKDTKNFVQNVLGTNQYSIKIGDKSFTYDWAQPISAPMTIMANIVNSKKNKEQALFESIVGSLDTAGSVLLEQSFLQSLNNVFSDNDNIVGNLVNEILELPARAVPTFSKQVADMVDGTQRQTYEKDKPVKTAINKFLVKMPGASKTLAPKVNTMGEDVLKYGGKNNIFNVMLNPANINRENASEAGKEIYKVYQATGNKNIFPRTAPYTVTMKNNEKVTLTTDQIAEFQRTSGTMIEKSLDKIINTSEYKNLSDDEKASVIKNIVDYSYNYASNQITGKDMASTYNKANIFVNNGGNLGDYYLHKDEADYSIDNPERYKAITSIGKFDDIYGYIKEVNEIKKQVSNDKEATIQYVENLDLSIPQKAILIKLISSNYKLDNYNVDIINYIDENIDNMEDKIAILDKLGFKVDDEGNVRW